MITNLSPTLVSDLSLTPCSRCMFNPPPSHQHSALAGWAGIPKIRKPFQRLHSPLRSIRFPRCSVSVGPGPAGLRIKNRPIRPKRPQSRSPPKLLTPSRPATAARKSGPKHLGNSNALTGETHRQNQFLHRTRHRRRSPRQWRPGSTPSDQIEITKTGARATQFQHQVAFLGESTRLQPSTSTLPEGTNTSAPHQSV